MTAQQIITKRLKGQIARGERMFKHYLKKAWKHPEDVFYQSAVCELRQYWAW